MSKELKNSMGDIKDSGDQRNDKRSGIDEIIESVEKNMPDDEYLYDLADLFRIFGDTTRVRILYSLFDNELCVGDISEVLNLTQSSVSHQLRILKGSKLVKFRRDGKSIFYSLDDDHVRSILNLCMEHLEEQVKIN